MLRMEGNNMIKIYVHNVKYYETDQMGIVHHSNYIRWFEEARLDVMEQIGFGYDVMEKSGIISPVVEINCRYKNMVYFNDTVSIYVSLKELKALKFYLEYNIRDSKTNEIKATGSSVHCFLSKDGRPIVINKEMSDFAEALQKLK